MVQTPPESVASKNPVPLNVGVMVTSTVAVDGGGFGGLGFAPGTPVKVRLPDVLPPKVRIPFIASA
jgi:hypothetical protein